MRRTKRFFVEEIHKNDNTLSKTKLFKMKIDDLENMFNNLNLTPSNSDTYSRADFDDISDDEKEPDVQQDDEKPVAEQPVAEPIVSKPEPEPKVAVRSKEKFNRRDVKSKFFNQFNKEITELLKELDDNLITDELALNEYNMLHEDYLDAVEQYTADMDMTERDIEYVDNFFALQEKRILQYN
jgi:hypothetical protein